MSTVTETRNASSPVWDGQVGNAVLGHGDFLTLLITQLKHQDPISPMKDQEFAAQMAQFSSLESLQHLSSQFERFVDLQERTSQIGQAANLIGKTVDIESAEGLVTGRVGAVRIVEGVLKLVLGDVEYPVEALREVRA